MRTALATATFAGFVCAAPAWAVLSGGQAGNPTTAILCNFAGGPYMSAPLNVSVPSTLLLNSAFNAKPPSGVVISSEMYVTVSLNNSVLSSLKLDYALGSGADGARFSASGFSADANRNSIILAPGAYVLQLTGYIGCGDGSPFNMTNMYIGWTLLSSAFDRIHADGFGAIG